MFRFVRNHLQEIYTKYLKNLSSSCFLLSFGLFRVLNVLYDLSDDDTLGTETCSCVECHLLNCVLSEVFYNYFNEHCNTAGCIMEEKVKTECGMMVQI